MMELAAIRDMYRYQAGDTPDEKLNHFIAEMYAHRAAYASGPFAAFGLAGWVLYKRYKLAP